MAENTVLNLGSGGDLIATDELTTINGAAAAAGLKVQRVKIGFGADNILQDVDAANGLPVVGAFFPATQPVSAASLPLPTGAATETSLAGVRTDLGTDGTTPPAVLGAGTGVRGWLRSIYEKLTGTLAVTGTFWQATQPVSGTFFQAAQPVTDNAGSLTVDAPVGTPVFVRLSDGTTAIAILPTNATQINGVALAVGSGVSGTGVQRVVLATDVIQPAISEIRAATLHVTATAAVNTAITATLPAPAAGLFHYITSVELVKLYSVLGVAAGAGVVITSTNLPGTPAWLTQQAAGAVGTSVEVIKYQPTTPLKAAAAALATTFVAPAQLQTIWRWNVSYFTAA